MKRFTQLLGTLFAIGCGSGAYASPTHGQWLDPNVPQDDQTTTTSSQTQTVQGDCPQQPDVTQNLNATPAPQAQPQDQQDQDDDAAVAPSSQVHLGILVMPLNAELRQHFNAPADRGVLVAHVEDNSAASRAGLQVGDVLVRVGPHQVRTGSDVIQALAAQGGGRIRLVVVRNGTPARLDAFLPVQNAPDQDQL